MAATYKKRAPAHVEMTGGKGSRQRAWEQVRKFGINKGFTTEQLSIKTNIEAGTLQTYLHALTMGGFLEAKDISTGAVPRKHEWKLIRDNGVEAPRLTREGKPLQQGMGTEAMWRSMRIIGDFNYRELAAHASTSGQEVKDGTAKAYVIMLYAAGYLSLTKPAKNMVNGAARYRLAPGKYTGPRPPMIQRTKSVYDPNLNEVVWQQTEKNHDDL
ncbi:hypothetical protein GTP58_28260 [Duganella sp. CY15W]|uniref:hypothetical protein n=1 Tax=Duganella sp. CY15W TaxID=2692172 RepID=UPI00136C3BA0|nr:hypothetical protein [Duganella sp. CY15W]MYM32233.1 hypothetical protein [Duganella sp. CY15W]